MEITNPDVVKAQVKEVMRASEASGNSSGQGKNSQIPEEVRGWSWGAFLLNFIWSASNNVWIGFLAIIPYVGIVVMFLLGLKGREWAWQSRHWESVEEFNRIQRKWSRWGVVSSLVGVIIILLISVVGGKFLLDSLY